MPSLKSLRQELSEKADPAIAEHSQRFFKSGPGEYGEGDQFIGVRVPVLRDVAKRYRDLTLKSTVTLLHSPVHEERLTALLILVSKFERGSAAEQKEVYDCYVGNRGPINNWDLVDCSAHKIVGPYLRDRSRRVLYRWAKSKSMWDRRIALMATFAFIREHDFDDTLELSEMLLNDPEDLIHKMVGWMLREVGKRDLALEEAFLKIHYKEMPRTMLRYAIEKFPEAKRKRYLNGKI